jgi:hypothetical protein
MQVAPVVATDTGPWLWPARSLTPLAVDATGTRMALTDGARIGVWNGRTRRLEQVIEASRHVVTDAAFSPSGAALLVRELQSPTQPALQRLRVVSLETGRTLAVARLPCGCLVDAAFTSAGQVRAALSSAAIHGTWLLRWATDGRLLDSEHVSDEVLDGSASGLFAGGNGDVFAMFTEGDDGDTHVTVIDPSTARLHAVSAAGEGGCSWADARCTRLVDVGVDRTIYLAWSRDGETQIQVVPMDGVVAVTSLPRPAATPAAWVAPGELLLSDNRLWTPWSHGAWSPSFPARGPRSFASGWTRASVAAPIAVQMGLPLPTARAVWGTETQLGVSSLDTVVCGADVWRLPVGDRPEAGSPGLCSDLPGGDRRRTHDSAHDLRADESSVRWTDRTGGMVLWEAPAGAWVKGVVPVAVGVAMVRLVRQDRPSAERWLSLRVDGAGRVSEGADRFFLDVVAAHGAGGRVAVLERSGVLTELRVARSEVAVERRTFLVPGRPDWVQVTKAGLRSSRTPEAAAWLGERHILF